MRYDNDPMTWIGRHGFSGNPEQVQAGFDLLNAASLLRDQAAVLESCHQGDLVQVAGIVSRHLREVLDLLDGLHGDERPAGGHGDCDVSDAGVQRDDAGSAEQVRDIECAVCVLGRCIADLARRADHVALSVDRDEKLLHVSSSVGGVEQDAPAPSSGSGAGEPTEEAPTSGCHLQELTGSCRRCQAGGAS